MNTFKVIIGFDSESCRPNDERSHAGTVILKCNRDGLPALADALGSDIYESRCSWNYPVAVKRKIKAIAGNSLSEELSVTA